MSLGDVQGGGLPVWGCYTYSCKQDIHLYNARAAVDLSIHQRSFTQLYFNLSCCPQPQWRFSSWLLSQLSLAAPVRSLKFACLGQWPSAWVSCQTS